MEVQIYEDRLSQGMTFNPGDETSTRGINNGNR